MLIGENYTRIIPPNEKAGTAHLADNLRLRPCHRRRWPLGSPLDELRDHVLMNGWARDLKWAREKIFFPHAERSATDVAGVN